MIVSNVLWRDAHAYRRDFDDLGWSKHVAGYVSSLDVGWRKPHPAIFERALEALGVDPAATLFVGDTLATDVAGAAALGMHTCLALWFRADEDDEAPEPEFRAFTQMDVMTAVRRLGQKS